MAWTLAKWTLTTDVPRDVLEAVLGEFGYQHMVAYIVEEQAGCSVSLLGSDVTRPSVELQRICSALVARGRRAECSLTG